MLIIGDLHLECIWDGLNRTEDVFDFIKQLPVTKEEDIIWLGDIFDTPYVSHSVVSRFMDYLSLMNLNGNRHYILCGNHDGEPGTKKGSPLEEIRASGLASVLFEPMVFNDWVFLPYTSQKVISDFCQDLSKFDGKTVFTHMDIADVIPGIESEIGRGSPCLLPNGVIQRAKKVWAGHIHKPQDIGNLTVVGSVIKLKISELEDRRYFHDGVAIPYQGRNLWSFTIDFSTQDGKTWYENTLNGIGLQHIPDAIVAVDFTCPHNLAHEVDQGKIQDAIWKAGCYHLRFDFHVVLEKKLRMQHLNAKMTDYEVVKSYIETQGVSDQELILKDVQEIIK